MYEGPLEGLTDQRKLLKEIEESAKYTKRMKLVIKSQQEFFGEFTQIFWRPMMMNLTSQKTRLREQLYLSVSIF